MIPQIVKVIAESDGQTVPIPLPFQPHAQSANHRLSAQDLVRLSFGALVD